MIIKKSPRISEGIFSSLMINRNPYHAFNLAELFNIRFCYAACYIYHGVRIFFPGFIGEVFNVNAAVRNQCGNLGQHGRHIPVDQRDPHIAAAGHGYGGQVDGILNVPVFQLIQEFHCRHGCAVFFTFRGGRA